MDTTAIANGTLTAHHACDALMLGAWGCGVFQNDLATVAQVFARYLRSGGAFSGRFRHVADAVYVTITRAGDVRRVRRQLWQPARRVRRVRMECVVGNAREPGAGTRRAFTPSMV